MQTGSGQLSIPSASARPLFINRNFDVDLLGIYFGPLNTIFLAVGILCVIGGLYATTLHVPAQAVGEFVMENPEAVEYGGLREESLARQTSLTRACAYGTLACLPGCATCLGLSAGST